MLFNSMTFVIFLTIVFMIYWAVPHKYRWLLLLCASYYFYMSWNSKYIVLILFMTIVSYLAARLLEQERLQNKKNIILLVTIVMCLGLLLFYKYFNFFSNSVIEALNIFALQLHPVTLNIVLPIGISFYTFQTLAYVIDVYKGKVAAERHFGIYATFISFFPQLLAGPIARAESILPQIREKHQFDCEKALYGAKMVLWGYFKKIVIADLLVGYVDQAFGSIHEYTGFVWILIAFFLSLQIYCDFSGYSDIAIGTAKFFGIDLKTNFKSPYFADSIKEFWTRWHISLSTCFRDYVYIPLGGNRCSHMRKALNLMITFLVSGLWHGANWTFVIWGGIHGAAQILENVFMKGLHAVRTKKVGKFFMTLGVFIFCSLAWIFFRADTFADAFYVI